METEGEGGSWIFWISAEKLGSVWVSVVDYVCGWGKAPFEMETLNTLLVGWLVFVFISLILAKFAYNRLVNSSKNNKKGLTNGVIDELNGPNLSVDGGKGSRPVRAKIVPVGLPERLPAPTAGGQDPDAVRWVNSVLVWFFEGKEGGPLVRNVWNEALNEITVGGALETGLLIEILEFLPATPPPSLSNVLVECQPNDDMTLVLNADARLFLRIQTTRTQRDVTIESEYACAVHSLKGRITADIRTQKCLAYVKWAEHPKVSLEVEGIRNNSNGLDEEQLQEVVKEEVSLALQKAELELRFSDQKSFPKFSRARSLPSHVIPVGYDSMDAPQHSPVGIVGLNGKRLLVKVVKAASVGGDKGVNGCYAVAELDEPPQRFLTNVVSDTNSPFWDEQFLFDLSDNTLELLFELYDKSEDRFVGLGIVGIEELIATPSQRQIIPLQGRPCENDEVSGSLTCEFLFLDRADLPDFALRKSDVGQRLSNTSGDAPAKPVTMTYLKTDNESDSAPWPVTGDLAEKALKDLEERQGSVSTNTRSTLIIHASKKVNRDNGGDYNERPNDTSLDPDEETDYENFKPGLNLGDEISSLKDASHGRVDPRIYDPASDSDRNMDSYFINRDSEELKQPPESRTTNGTKTNERGRSRDRFKGGFFGSLRRKLSRSKSRSASVEPTGLERRRLNESMDKDPLAGRSVSMERSRHSLRRGFLTVPSKKRNAIEPDGSGSGGSSLSGASGMSATTYVNDASLMIIESFENGIVKHYLIPLSMQKKNKWRKRGTKLHVYNEHIFVAKHFPRSTTCEVCQKNLGIRLGKQGYECRDCSMKCHKPCHVKVSNVCPNSSVNSIDLVIVKDEQKIKKTKS